MSCVPRGAGPYPAGARPLRAATAGHGRWRLRGDDLPVRAPVPVLVRRLREGDVRRAGGRADQQARAPRSRGDRGAGGGGAGTRRAGARLSGRLAAQISRMTLLRLVRAMPGPALSSAPRDWAWTTSPLQPLDDLATADFYELVVARHRKNPTIVTSNRTRRMGHPYERPAPRPVSRRPARLHLPRAHRRRRVLPPPPAARNARGLTNPVSCPR